MVSPTVIYLINFTTNMQKMHHFKGTFLLYSIETD